MGLATNPKQLEEDGIKKQINRALRAQNLRQQLPEGETRHEFKALHGFRKFFKTNAERVMKPLNVELLMDHDTGVSDSYWRPTEKEVLEDYLKAVEFLTINDQKTTLQKQVKELSVKNEQDNYIIKGKLADKEKELEEIKEHQRRKDEEVARIQSSFSEMMGKIGTLERNAIELSKSIIAERKDWVCIQDEKDPNALVVHVYDKALKSLRPVTIKEAREGGIKDGHSKEIEIELANDEPALNIEHKGTIEQHRVYKMSY